MTDNDTISGDGRIDELTRTVSEWARSRRSFMGDAAKIGGGALALSAGIGTAAAEKSSESSGVEAQASGGYAALEDLEILNFALLLERLEATFYTEAVGTAEIGERSDDGRLSELELDLSQPALQFVSEGDFSFSTYEYFQRIRNHEQAHVNALVTTIENAGGTPVQSPGFTFPYESAEEFVALAQVFEDTGAAAYTAAAPFIDEQAYLAAAAKIEAVEARHASYLRVLTTEDQIPFPRAFQRTLSVEQVNERVAPFIDG
jgi:hypothetical protein